MKLVEVISGWRPTAYFGISSTECFGAIREYTYWRLNVLTFLATALNFLTHFLNLAQFKSTSDWRCNVLLYKGHIFHHISDHRVYHKPYYIASLHLLLIWNPFFPLQFIVPFLQ